MFQHEEGTVDGFQIPRWNSGNRVENLLYGPINGFRQRDRGRKEGLSKGFKAGLKGTSITEKDAKEIIDGVQAMYDKVPSFIRPMLPSLPDVLKRIPSSAAKYSLAEIIQLLDWAYENGQLKR